MDKLKLELISVNDPLKAQELKHRRLTLLLSSGFLLVVSLTSRSSFQAPDWTGVSDKELVRTPDQKKQFIYFQFSFVKQHQVTSTCYL